MVIGINGLDCSGKTTFSKALHGKLRGRNIKTALLHIDDYNDLKVQKLIYQAHEKGDFTKDLLNLYYNNSIHYDAVLRAVTASRENFQVTIIEGVFLFKECLLPNLDIKVFLSVDPVQARARYVKRKDDMGDKRPVSVFDEIWMPAFARYCSEVQPEKICDIHMPSSWISRPSSKK
ncbi:MAG: hypothetical protein COB59_00015 [Rhodospirillaceae bacterium]|nr:MAG: hypothetical protein COB59_00015 [Rhodospirillaceae bacterium]